MREKGQFVKRGSLSAEGDVEFWDDGTTTPRSANFIPNTTTKSDPEAEEGRLTESPASASPINSDVETPSSKL
jgi:protein import protein ZIM17